MKNMFYHETPTRQKIQLSKAKHSDISEEGFLT